MKRKVKAIRYRSIDEAKRVLAEHWDASAASSVFDDAGQEPQGLLAALPEDRIPEEVFYRLFEGKVGVLVELERIAYSGYGPPSEEEDYMGFVAEQVAYVLQGCRFRIEIRSCPQGAKDIHHLEALVDSGLHPIDRDDLARKLGLSRDWDFEDLFQLVSAREYSGEELDRLIHRGIQ